MSALRKFVDLASRVERHGRALGETVDDTLDKIQDRVETMDPEDLVPFYVETSATVRAIDKHIKVCPKETK